MIITGKKFSKPAMSRVINGDTELKQNDVKKPRQRLDLLLVAKHPEYNRSTLQNFIKSGYVSVDGRIVTKPNAEIIYYDQEALNAAQDLPENERPQNPEIILVVPDRQTPPSVKDFTIYEDDNVLVINKPAGLLSMAKGEFTTEPTLEDYGLLVHRLDRDTSGVVILAKNPAVQSNLRRQFQERNTHKTYFAIVEGRPKLDAAKIDLPIIRNMKHPTTFMVDANGKPSQTYYQVAELLEKDGQTYSLIELHPLTGRTHQLRVHLNYLGHPILGDPVYGDAKANDKSGVHRLLLHASSLEITLPGGNRTVFTAPLPTDFNEFLASCKRTPLEKQLNIEQMRSE